MEITLTELGESKLTMMRWFQIAPNQYEMTAGDYVYGSLRMSLQPVECSSLRPEGRFFRGEASTPKAQYLFGCTFEDGRFHGHELWDLDRPHPLGKCVPKVFSTPWSTRGHIQLEGGGNFDWIQERGLNLSILARSTFERLFEFRMPTNREQGILKILDDSFAKSSMGSLLIFFGIYLIENPCR